MPWLNSIRMAPRLATLSVALSMVLAAMAPGVQAITGLPDFTELVRTNSPAVVNISTKEGTDKPAHAKSNKPKALPPGAPLPNMPDDRSLNDFFRHFFGDQMPPGGPDGPDGPGGEPHMSLGSGFIVSSDGYVISIRINEVNQLSVWRISILCNLISCIAHLRKPVQIVIR